MHGLGNQQTRGAEMGRKSWERTGALCVCALAAICCLASTGYADIPLMINHQGLVKVNGEPFTGNGDFRFGFFDSNSLWLWTNDGSFVGMSVSNQPSTAVTLPVTYGVYSVRLGDLSLTGMDDPLSSSVFEGDEVKLRVIFSD